jgi:MerR family transcriptional regulator, copper efflux regulator
MACTLEPDDIPDRLAAWHALLAGASAPATDPDGATRVEFGDSNSLPELARLVAAEQQCCGFLSFTITVDRGGTALEVRSPQGASDIVAKLFGSRLPLHPPARTSQRTHKTLEGFTNPGPPG